MVGDGGRRSLMVVVWPSVSAGRGEEGARKGEVGGSVLVLVVLMVLVLLLLLVSAPLLFSKLILSCGVACCCVGEFF